MPLTAKGRKILSAMKRTYKDKDKAERVFYASRNAGKITDVEKKDQSKRMNARIRKGR